MAMKQSKIIQLHHLIGLRLRQLREGLSLTQEQFASVARQHGVPWRRSLVAQLETGRRHLSIEEFFALPVVLDGLVDHPLRRILAGLEEATGGLALTPSLVMDGEYAAKLLENKGHYDPGTMPPLASPTTHHAEELAQLVTLGRTLWGDVGPSSDLYASALRDANGEAERKAANTLHVRPTQLALVSLKLWGHSLTEEREAELEREAQLHGTEASPRIRQALRGHATRKLIEKLRNELAQRKEAKRATKAGRSRNKL
jgi:transcriptional regulator with XRE-family HTH domain